MNWSAGSSPTRSSASRRNRFAIAWDAVDGHRFGDRASHPEPRIERLVRILEDHLHPPPEPARLGAGDRAHVDTVDQDRAPVAGTSPHGRERRRGLAAARLADQRDELAGVHVDRHAVDGPHQADGAAQQRAEQAARLTSKPTARSRMARSVSSLMV